MAGIIPILALWQLKLFQTLGKVYEPVQKHAALSWRGLTAHQCRLTSAVPCPLIAPYGTPKLVFVLPQKMRQSLFQGATAILTLRTGILNKKPFSFCGRF